MPNNSPPVIEIRMNPPDLLQRMAKYPKQLDKEMGQTMDDAIKYVWVSVPAYPPKSPNSRYVRTGTLGRSLGSSGQGGRMGNPDIKQTRRIGQGKYEGRFGTRLHYAPKVIGANTQLPLFKKLGWFTMKTIQDKATKGVVMLFEKMAQRMVKFLGG